jgi:hypothetical protein
MRTVKRLTQLNLPEPLGQLNPFYLVGCLILLGLLLRLPFLRLGLFRDEGSTYFNDFWIITDYCNLWVSLDLLNSCYTF